MGLSEPDASDIFVYRTCVLPRSHVLALFYDLTLADKDSDSLTTDQLAKLNHRIHSTANGHRRRLVLVGKLSGTGQLGSWRVDACFDLAPQVSPDRPPESFLVAHAGHLSTQIYSPCKEPMVCLHYNQSKLGSDLYRPPGAPR